MRKKVLNINQMGDITNNQFLENMYLQCSDSPNLNDLELSQLSDEILYICDDVLFTHILIDDDFKEDIKTNIKFLIGGQKYTTNNTIKNLKNRIFPDDNVTFITKSDEMRNSLENLSDKLFSINNKKDVYDTPKTTVNFIIGCYVLFFFYSLYKYMQLLGDNKPLEAMVYDIGFISNIAYIYMASEFKSRFFEYSELTMTMGNLDSSICSELSNVVNNLKELFSFIIKYKEAKLESNNNVAANCKNSIIVKMMLIYNDVKIKNIFIAAKSHFKQTVNYINKFIDKQKQFLLKQENIEVRVSNNENMEKFYKLVFKGMDQGVFDNIKPASVARAELSNNYEDYLKTKILQSFVERLYITPDIKDNLIKTVLDNANELKKRYLPEYDNIIRIVFPLDFNEYSKISRDEYIEEIVNRSDDPNVDENMNQYFLQVRELYVTKGTLIDYNGEQPDTFLTSKYKETDQTNKSQIVSDLFVKIPKSILQSNKNTLKERYIEFVDLVNSRNVYAVDFKNYDDIYSIVKTFFIEQTEEYNLTEIIVMKYMLYIINNDMDITGENKKIISQNMNTITMSLMQTVRTNQEIKTRLLDNKDINTARYISFIKFDSKMKTLSNDDVNDLGIYINNIYNKLKEFRRYIKTEETTFSKKFQLLNIFEKLHQNVTVGSGILLTVFFYNYLLSDESKESFKKRLAEGSRAASKAKKAAIEKAKEGVELAKEKGKSMMKKKGGADESDNIESEKDEKSKEKTKKDVEEKKKAEQSKWIISSLILVGLTIILVFIKSYLIKHKADLNYDRLVNVVNTTSFEKEFNRLNKSFQEYKKNRDTVECKVIYYKLIELFDIYDKCNFIKNSMKKTPFPMTEMWTNGVVLLIFLAIIYVVFTTTDVENYWKNKDTFDEIQADIEKTFSKDAVSEEIEDTEKLSKMTSAEEKEAAKEIADKNEEEKGKLKKLLEKDKFKMFITKLEKYGKLDDETKTILEEADKEEDVNKKKENYESVLETVYKGGFKGGMMGPMGMGMGTDIGALSDALQSNNDGKMQKKLLEKYTNAVQRVDVQLVNMQRDTKYVNMSMALMILMFGAYFCTNILNNTVRYESMLTSGGVLRNNCL